MNRIKNIAFSTLLALSAFSAVTYTSCSKDECKDVTCNNGGSCSGGSCTCPSGYEGKTCDARTRDKFIGYWSGTDACSIGSATYHVNLQVDSSSTDGINAVVKNPGNFGTSVIISGTVVSTNQLSFTNADLGGNRKLNGTMTFTGGSTGKPSNMTFDYVVTPDTGSVDNCQGIYTRQ